MGADNLSISLGQQFATNPYVDHSGDYIPKTTNWDPEHICEFMPGQPEDKQRCCSSTKTIDRALDKAYRNGLQSHLGINAITNYPCVTEHEMGTLSNDLNNKIRRFGIPMDLPKDLDPTKRPLSTTKEIRNYCKEVIFETLARELDRVRDSRPIAFTKQVVKYCQYALTLRPSSLDPSTYLNKGWGEQ